MSVSRINPPSLSKPSGFSHATRCGQHIYLAGQTAMAADGSICPGGIVAQFRQALENLLVALRAAGGEPEDLAAITVYLLDIPDYQANGAQIGAVWRELVGGDYPAMTGVGVTSLWQREALIEIAATAIVS